MVLSWQAHHLSRKEKHLMGDEWEVFEELD
jgi:hypothetical protein